MIATVAALDALGSLCSGIAISVGWAAPAVTLALVAVSRASTAWWQKRRLASFFLIFAQYIAFANAAAVLSYLAAACRFPLVDDALTSIDHAIGFDWLALFNWINTSHPAIGKALDLIYWSMLPQLAILAAYLSASGRLGRIRELSWLVVISLLLILPLSMLLPAEGAWVHHDVATPTGGAYLQDLRAIRAGAMQTIDLSHLNGIIQFPSFHAALGLILILSSRRTLLFPLYLPLNAAMIFAAIPAGGHYLIDIIFGLATVAAAVFILRGMRIDPELRTR